MMRFTSRLAFWGAVLAIIVACAHPDRPFRDVNAPIGATSRFDADEFSGDWIVTESFRQRQREQITFTYNPENAEVFIDGNSAAELSGPYRQGISGELIPVSPLQETLVVMWVDDDFRTAVLGTPSGSLGLVLDRTGDVTPDRAQAVRDILEFYGWNTSQLKRTL